MIYNRQIANKLIEEYKNRKAIADKQYDYYVGKTDIYKTKNKAMPRYLNPFNINVNFVALRAKLLAKLFKLLF